MMPSVSSGRKQHQCWWYQNLLQWQVPQDLQHCGVRLVQLVHEGSVSSHSFNCPLLDSWLRSI